MPIIEMKKVFLLGHRDEKAAIVDSLNRFGSVQLLDVKSGSAWDEFAALLEPDQPSTEVTVVESRLGEIRYCLDFFQRHFPVRKSFIQQFTGAKLEIAQSDYEQYITGLGQVEELYKACREAEEKMVLIRNEETQRQNLCEELRPWLNLDLPIEEITEGVFAFSGLYTVTTDHAGALQEALSAATPAHHISIISETNEFTYFFLTALQEERSAVQEIMKEHTVSSVDFSALQGTAAENVAALEEQVEESEGNRAAVLAEVEGLLEQRSLLMAGHDYLANEMKKYDAVENLARTENSFLLEGWVPVPLAGDLEKMVTEHTETATLVLRDPQPGEDVPILLHNKGPAEAYEVVTKLYSTPRKSELDPTPYLAPFFFIFFGICLSDVGYGAMLSIIALIISRKLKLGGMGKQLINLLIFGGLSSILFGVLLGSYFGDLLGMPALWFNPLDDPMRMLFYCFAIGLVHIYFGMSLQAYRNIKAGHPLSALFDQGFWFIFLNGLIMLMLPELALIGKWLAIGGAAGLILTQGRTQQGIAKKLMSGLVSLYNITGYLSDVLSYSRLLALGLATGVIASAINSMGGMIAGSVFGTIIMVLVLLGGHLFNIVISTLGSYVHTSRLQYIEFFGKFFEGGGKSFSPFAVQTSYIDVVEGKEAQ